MTAIRGGLRVRFIKEALYNTINEELGGLGWFDADRQHLPINFIDEAMDRDETIPWNTLVLSPEDATEWPTGLGESSAIESMVYYLEFYAENNSVALEMIFDLKDILLGRIGNRTYPRVEVFDYRQATPPSVGFVQIEDVLVDRGLQFDRPWQKHLHVIRFDVVDMVGEPIA